MCAHVFPSCELVKTLALLVGASLSLGSSQRDTFGRVKVSLDTLVCVCVSVRGGGAVTLATQLHILQ